MAAKLTDKFDGTFWKLTVHYTRARAHTHTHTRMYPKVSGLSR